MASMLLYLIMTFLWVYIVIRIIALSCHYMRAWCWDRWRISITSFRVSLFMAATITLLMFLVMPGIEHTRKESVIGTVVCKEQVSSGSLLQDHFYLIYTVQQNGKPKVFSNIDSMMHGKLNSADVQALLEIGHTYEFQLIGMRMPILNKFQNVISFKEVIPDKQK